MISEEYVNATEGWSFGNQPAYEPYTDDIGRLFRDFQKEYGRCISSVYVDSESGPRRVGWVFSKRMRYEDVPDYYVREVWVTLHDAPDTVTREHHYHVL